jgi:hypothetical protein
MKRELTPKQLEALQEYYNEQQDFESYVNDDDDNETQRVKYKKLAFVLNRYVNIINQLTKSDTITLGQLKGTIQSYHALKSHGLKKPEVISALCNTLSYEEGRV